MRVESEVILKERVPKIAALEWWKIINQNNEIFYGDPIKFLIFKNAEKLALVHQIVRQLQAFAEKCL